MAPIRHIYANQVTKESFNKRFNMVLISQSPLIRKDVLAETSIFKLIKGMA